MGSKKKNYGTGGSGSAHNNPQKISQAAEGEYEEQIYISLDDDEDIPGGGDEQSVSGYDGDDIDYGDDTDGADGGDSDDDSIIPPFLRPFADKCGAALSRMDKNLNRHYFHPDSRKVVSEKTTYTTLIIAAVLSLILGFAVIIFLGTFHYHTTGMKTKDFIREFNAICSDTDIKALVPDYTDVSIPEDAKLGKEPVYLADGHVRLTARTRFGKIVDFTLEGIDIPNYDERHYSFLLENDENYDPSNGQFYYYIALGKAAIAAQKLIDAPELNEKNDPSSSDVSDSDSEIDLSYIPTVYEAASYGYQLYYYAFYYYTNRMNSGYVYLPIGKCHLDYELTEARLSVKPTLEKITNLPEGLQKFWDSFTGKNKEAEEDEADDQSQTVVVESAPVSSSEAVSDTAAAPAEPAA